MYDVLNEYLKRLRARNYAQGTLRHVKAALKEIFTHLQNSGVKKLMEIETEHIRTIQSMFFENASETAAHKTSYLRAFLRWAYAQGEISEDFACVLAPVKRKIKIHRTLSQKEMQEFLALPDVQTEIGLRDRAILELMYSSALRRGEVVNLALYDVNLSEGIVRVFGKGRKERIVPIGKSALFWIHRYVREVRGESSEKALFLNFQSGRRLGENGLGNVFVRYAKHFRRKVSPHALRHAAATHMLQNGASSRVVQEFLGHAQLSTTQIYTHVLVDDLRGVIEKFHPRGKLDAAR